MKIEIEDRPPVVGYPVLMVSKSLKQVVWFLDERKGVMIHPGQSTDKVGCHENWTPCHNPDIWELFNGIVKLSN